MSFSNFCDGLDEQHTDMLAQPDEAYGAEKGGEGAEGPCPAKMTKEQKEEAAPWWIPPAQAEGGEKTKEQKEEATSGMCWEAETARAEKARAAWQASKKRRVAGMMSATLIWQ